MPVPGLSPLALPGPSGSVGVDRPRFTAVTATETWHLGDATEDGTSWVVLMPGMTGLEHPPVTMYSAGSPQLAGARYTGLHVEPRPVFLPIACIASSYSEATDLRRRLIRAFSPLTFRGLVTLQAAQPDGTVRSLALRFTGEGMAGDESVDMAGNTWATYGLVATAYDPFWYGAQISPAPWSNPAPRPFYPLDGNLFRLSPSRIFGDAVLTNPGDVDAYPRWTLQGPATSITLATGEQSLTVNHPLASSGDLLIIDTDPTQRTIRTGGGQSVWADVPDGYELWTLQPGNTLANFAVAGANDETRLYLSYTPRYLRW